MHEDRGLRERLADEELEGRGDHVAVGAGQLEREVSVEEPFRHLGELAGERRAIVRRQLSGRLGTAQLYLGKRLQRIAVKQLRVVPGAQPREIVRAAQILEQHESPAHIGLVYVRNVDSERLEQRRHV